MTLETHAPHIPVFKRRLGSWQIAVSRQGFADDQLRRAYDDCAPSWQRTIERLGFPLAYRQVLRQLVPTLTSDRERPVKVLDCGVGTGAMALALAAEMDASFELSAVDISPVMLEEASGKFGLMGVNCQPQVADIRALPFASESFDFVMCAHAIEHLEVPQAAISEMYRVLKPGGTLLVVTTRKTLFGTFIHLKWRTHRLTSSALRQWLTQSGLTDLETMPVGAGRWTRLWSTAVSGRKPLSTIRAAQDNTPCAASRSA